jgi:charged multivesicular body protein 2A
LTFSQLRLPQIQRILQEFEKQSTSMEMKGEMMTEAIDEVMGEDEDEDQR